MQGFAALYDTIMENADYDGWFNYIYKIIEEKGIKGKDVLDLGCGTAEISIRFKKKGYSVLGVDISDEMLAIEGKTKPYYKDMLFFKNLSEWPPEW